MDDCGELHDDMCAYFEYAGNAAAAAGKQVRTRGNPSVQEQVRARLFEDGGSVIGRRVCKVVGKTLHEGQVTKTYRSAFLLPLLGAGGRGRGEVNEKGRGRLRDDCTNGSGCEILSGKFQGVLVVWTCRDD